jgi:hypothetical protein
MSEQEYIELSRKLDYGLRLAEKRMLHEKALHGEDIIVCDDAGSIVRIPARQVIADHPVFQ